MNEESSLNIIAVKGRRIFLKKVYINGNIFFYMSNGNIYFIIFIRVKIFFLF